MSWVIFAKIIRRSPQNFLARAFSSLFLNCLNKTNWFAKESFTIDVQYQQTKSNQKIEIHVHKTKRMVKLACEVIRIDQVDQTDSPLKELFKW